MAERDIQGVPSHLVSKTIWIDPTKEKIAKSEGLPALLLPNGTVLVCPNAFASEAAVKVFVDTMLAQRISVHGTWVFIPDDEDLRFEE